MELNKARQIIEEKKDQLQIMKDHVTKLQTDDPSLKQSPSNILTVLEQNIISNGEDLEIRQSMYKLSESLILEGLRILYEDIKQNFSASKKNILDGTDSCPRKRSATKLCV